MSEDNRIFLDHIAYVVARQVDRDYGYDKIWVVELPLMTPWIEHDMAVYNFDSAILRRSTLEELKGAVKEYMNGKAARRS